MYFDPGGTLNFRAGTGTAQVTINTSGKLVAGDGAVILDIFGLSIASGTDDKNSIRFTYGGSTTLEISHYYDTSFLYSYIQANAKTSCATLMAVRAEAPTSLSAETYLTTVSGSQYTHFSLYLKDTGSAALNGLFLSSLTTANANLHIDNDFYCGGHTRIEGGLYVGSASGTPTTDDIIVDGTIAAGADIYPAGDAGGIARRYSYYLTPTSSYFYGMDSDPGWTTITYSPFSIPGSLTYSASHMQITMSATSAARHFIAKTTYTPTSNYIYAQLGLSAGGADGGLGGTFTGIGVRLDDGSNDDDNFVELFLSYTGTAGQYKIRRRAATGGGAIDDDVSTVTLPFAQILMQIYIAKTDEWNAWTAQPIISIGMTGMGASRIDVSTASMAWTPTRVGIVTQKSSDTSSWYQGYCDFLYTY
jgi:hypothetical protein